jgi:hypothetical protein
MEHSFDSVLSEIKGNAPINALEMNPGCQRDRVALCEPIDY